ncbi:MAG TPA: PASTA domain-containing protein, partial [Coriobacteriia bacterium]
MKTPYRPAHGAGAGKRAARAGTPDDGVAPVEDPASGSGGSSLVDAVRARWNALGTTGRGRAIRGAAIAVAALVILGAMIAFSRRPVAVPQLVGLTQSAATRRLTDAGLVLVVQGTALSPSVAKGSVASQDPTAGVSLARGSLVVVLISAGTGTFPLQDLLGMTLDQATAALHD